MAAKQTVKYGVAAIAIALVIIAGAVVSMSPAATTSQNVQTSSQTSSGQVTTQSSSPQATTIQLGTSTSRTSSQSSATQGQGGSGILSVYLTDAPPSGQTLKYLLVNVSSLELRYQSNITTGTTSSTTSTTTTASTSSSTNSSTTSTTSSATTTTTTSTTSTGTQPQNVYILTVASAIGRNVNLTSLHGQSLLLGGTTMPAGSITSIVLNLTGAKAFYTDGSTEQLKVVADGKLMVPIRFSIQANGSTDLTIDLTPNLVHISQAGILTPVIHVTTVEMGRNGTTTHTMEVDEAKASSATTTK